LQLAGPWNVWAVPEPAAGDDAPVEFHGRCAGQPLRILLPARLLGWLADGLPAPAAASLPPAAQVAPLLEEALRTWWAGQPALSSLGPPSVLHAGPAPAGPLRRQALEARRGMQEGALFHIEAPEDLLAELAARLLDPWEHWSDWQALPMPLSIVAAHAWLSCAQLAELEAGDLLLPDAACTADGPFALQQGAHRIALVRVRAGEVLVERLAARHQEVESPEMSYETDLPGTAVPLLSALQVRVTAELARLEMPLSALVALAPGQVLDVACSPQHLRLYANGCLVAEGALCERDGQPAIAVHRVLHPR
jgi:flagellar motor switch/type III secretory pathway protein FliN